MRFLSGGSFWRPALTFMKKKILYGIVGLLIILLIAILAWKFLKKPDIQVQWGMTKEQIKQYESTLSGTLKTESASSLIYESRLFEQFPVAVEYEFNNGKLVRRKYMPLEKYLSSEESDRDYRTIRQRLLSRHGDPQITKEQEFRLETWRCELFCCTPA